MTINTVTIVWDNLNTIIYEEDDETLIFCNNILKDKPNLKVADTFFENENYLLKVEKIKKDELDLLCIWK